MGFIRLWYPSVFNSRWGSIGMQFSSVFVKLLKFDFFSYGFTHSCWNLVWLVLFRLGIREFIGFMLKMKCNRFLGEEFGYLETMSLACVWLKE